MTKFYLTILVAAISGFINAQTHGDLSFELGLPQNEFKEKRSDAAYGVKFSLYFPVQKKSPLFIGFGLGYMGFGSKTQYLHEDLSVYAGNVLVGNIPIDLKASTNNNLFHGYIGLRYKYPSKFIQPYIEGQVGFNNFFTRTTIYDESYNRMFTYGQDNNVINKSTAINSTTYNYGFEGGLIIPFGNGCSGLNLGVAYLWGGQAKYYSRDQIQYWTVSFDGAQNNWDPNNIDPETIDLISDYSSTPNKSYTDMLVIRIGFTFGLCQKTKTTKTAPAKSKTTTTKKTTTRKPTYKTLPPSKSYVPYPPPPPPPPVPPPVMPPPRNPKSNNK